MENQGNPWGMNQGERADWAKGLDVEVVDPSSPFTHEYLYCEEGAITLWVAGEKFDLVAGDVAAFPGDQAHTYVNAGTRPSVGFSVVTLAPMA